MSARTGSASDWIGVVGRLTPKQINAIVDYVKNEPSLYEVIASGGNPLTHPRGLEQLFTALAPIEHVRILRIHTRFPLQLPDKVNMDLMRRIATLKPTVFLSLHIDHPDELTPPVIELIREFRKAGLLLISQSVFLKGVNDSVDVLEKMFLHLFQLGVWPYYIYHCQRIPTTEHFVMDLADEVGIMTTLRERLSGLAFPQHVIDLPGARGKVLVPSDHWDSDLTKTRDFRWPVVEPGYLGDSARGLKGGYHGHPPVQRVVRSGART